MFSSNTTQVSQDATYIEDVFSTWLYTGNGSTQTINNGIDLAGKGGMVWIKSRSGAFPHNILDTVRGFNYSGTQTRRLDTATTDNEADSAGNATQATPLSNGFSVTTSGGGAINFYNASGSTYASWTFREQSKFFDIVTYTGTGSVQNISHNLGSVPGCMIIKDTTNNGSAWAIYHTSLGNTQFLQFTTSAAGTSSGYWNNTTPTSTQFTVGTNGNVNQSGATYVAYLFAHNAGGFGLTGTDNVISCGSFTTDGSGLSTVTLGYEPQFVIMKDTGASGEDWILLDTMRGWVNASGSNDALLRPNLSAAEVTVARGNPTSTGFQAAGLSGSSTYIYIAIRRGPMKVPTTGTSVFTPYEVPGSPTTGAITGFVTDAGFIGQRAGADKFAWGARLMGNPTLNSTNTNAESANTNQIWDRMNGWWNSAINGYMTWGFRRAPNFMDVVCYTGTGSNPNTLNHNLGVIPEFVIYRRRNSTGDWETGVRRNDGVYSQQSLNSTGAAYGTLANAAAAGLTATTINPPAFGSGVNVSGGTYVAYLFASCPGVSSVGSFTGTGATQVINCGFTTGARFVLIKATSTTGNWLVWDSARGIVAGNDPYLALNSTAAEVTNTDWVDTAATGFELSNAGGNLANSNGVSYIFLAIA